MFPISAIHQKKGKMKMTTKQLIMRHHDLSNVPELILPEGFILETHREGYEKEWENIIESAFGMHFDFDFLIKAGDYSPEKVLYLIKDGKPIATTTAVENEAFKGEGWFRMVGVHKNFMGMGAGKKIAVAALNSLRSRGYKTAVLSTDDYRIPAIKLYLSVGFEPVILDESHKERWKKVFDQIDKK